ncbi:gastrula zinc finger protein XlCGF57.1 [Nothobranchius furzeri]|uniref:Gastrula zinc finger protein XlCGF57.1-like n=1 Tax=Nothobranchius furzeri TaxID=105023 RepID=A0A9D3BCE3_NOTFU|nr:gastrula zinc finger protein XlCGF57.1 [Nothobranchius furzeri]KAF7204682.1 gastrula zinc finger protein XlCGF57.1-like [Nothobranchius furzeri]
MQQREKFGSHRRKMSNRGKSPHDQLDMSVFPVDVQQMMLNKEAAPEELSPGVSQMDLETLNIKKEEEDPLNEMMESCATSISSTAGSCLCEEDEDKVLSQFNQHQATDRDLPTSSCPDQIKAVNGEEDCGGAKCTRNPDINFYGDDSNSSEMKMIENKDDQDGNICDCQLKSLSDSEPETEDSEQEWNESESSESDVKAVNKSFSCPECGKRIFHKGSLYKHVRVSSPSAKSSSSCWCNEKSVGVEQNVDLCKKAQAELSFSCDHCGFSFNDKSKINCHTRGHAGQKPFACDVCGQRFRFKAHLIGHMKVHPGQKPLAADVRGQPFSENSNLNVQFYTKQKTFMCDVCGKGFNCMPHLIVHMRGHTGQKPFSCECCGQRFSQKSVLISHMRVHTGQKPFVCELCGQRFSQTSSLNRHVRVHTGQKPFDCKVCGQKFNLKAILNRHINVHTGQKPFVCDVCGKGFSQKTNLNTHMRVHTGLKPFVCDVCGDRFRHKVSLNTHVRVHTGNKTDLTTRVPTGTT